MTTNTIYSEEVMRLEQVAEILAVRTYVLEFWIKEFHLGCAEEDNFAAKFFTSEDLMRLSYIKKLLFEERLPINEVKIRLEHCSQQEHLTQESIIAEKESYVCAGAGWQVERNSSRQEQTYDDAHLEKARIEDLAQKLHFVKIKLSNVTQMSQEFKTLKNW